MDMIRFSVPSPTLLYRLDYAYRRLCQQRKQFLPEADNWHFHFRYPLVKYTLLFQGPAPDVFVAKAMSRISIKRHNGAMQLQLIRNIWEPTELIRFLVTTNIVLYIPLCLLRLEQ